MPSDTGPVAADGGAQAQGARLAWGLWLCPIVVFLAIFFVLPLAINVGQSLRGAHGVHGLSQYARIFGDRYYLRIIVDTIGLGAVVTAICLVLGYPLGLAISRLAGLAKTLLVFAVVAPLLVNVVVRTFGWMVLFSRNGALSWALSAVGLPRIELMYTWTGVVIALVHVLLPFMVLSIASALETLDPRFEEAARVLGASRVSVFRHVTLPLSLEGVVSGSILVFTATVGSFITVMLLGNTSTMVLPLLMYQQLTVASDWPFAAAMGTTLLTIVTVTLWLQSVLRRPVWRR